MRYFQLLLLGLAAVGCSSDDKGGSFENGEQPNKEPVVNLPGMTPVPGGTSEPGVTDLPPETVNQLRSLSCAGWSAEPEAVPAIIELVVDISSSMNQQAPGTGNRTKWEVTREALLEAIVGVDGPGLPGGMGVGLLFYPNRPNVTIADEPQNLTGCVKTDAMVPIQILGGPGAAHRERLEEAFRRAELNQSTPTHDAFRYALNEGLLKSRLPGSKYMLLITDGAPTLSLGCVNETGSLNEVDARPIVQEVRTAAEKYAKTFLIGSPGSESNRRWMSEAARIGGTAKPNCSDSGPNYCHMDLTTSPDFSAALREGLSDVAGQIVSCTYQIPQPPPGQSIDVDKINVIYTPRGSSEPKLVGRNRSSECKSGWQLEGNEVTICPDTCATIQEDAGATLELLFGCAAIDTPVR